MKIGLIGPPGAGKTELAEALAQELPGPVVVVDDYVRTIEERYDIATGVWGTYVGNVAIALERVGMERSALRDKAMTTITCGTLIETMTYTLMDGLNAARYTTLAKGNLARVQMTTTWFASLLMDTFDYNVALYLPGEKVELEGEEMTFMEGVISEIPTTLRTFNIEAIEVKGETIEDRKDFALAAIEEAVEHEAA